MTSTLVRGTFGVQKRGTPYEVATPLVEVVVVVVVVEVVVVVLVAVVVSAHAFNYIC